MKKKRLIRNKTINKITKGKPVNLLTLFPDFKKKKFLELAKQKQDDFLKDLKNCYLHKGLALYIGSGVSRSVGLPNWNELIKVLTIEMMTRRVDSAINTVEALRNGMDFEIYFKIREDVERNTDYNKPILMMARALKDELGDTLYRSVARNLYRYSRDVNRYLMYKRNENNKNRGFRSKNMKERFLRKSVKFPSSPLLDSIIALARPERDIKGVQAIVNYNYDDILEEKLRDEKVKCVTIKSGKDLIDSHALHSFHVHGVLPINDYINGRSFNNEKTFGNFVFSEDEYHNEYSDPYRWSNMTQISLLGQYTGLFIGLSLEDPNIRRLLDVTHRQYPENVNYAILPRKRNLFDSLDSKKNVLANIFEEVETNSFEKIGVKVIWADDLSNIANIVNEVYKV